MPVRRVLARVGPCRRTQTGRSAWNNAFRSRRGEPDELAYQRLCTGADTPAFQARTEVTGMSLKNARQRARLVTSTSRLQS